MKALPDKSILEHLFAYQDGMLIRKVKASSNAMPGMRAGGLNGVTQHRYVDIDGERYSEARVIWAMHHSDPGDLEVDHLNGDNADNRIENLCLRTHQDNCHHRYDIDDIGIDFRPTKNTWRVRIAKDGVRKAIGHFKTEAEARAARDAAVLEHWGIAA